MVDRFGGARHVEDERLELHHVNALHRGNGREPARGTAGAESNDERHARCRVNDGAEQAEHHLGAGVAAGGAVRFAVHDECESSGIGGQRDAALDAVALPVDALAHRVLPASQLVRRSEHVLADAPRPDAAVPPDRRRPGRGHEQHRGDGETQVRRQP